MSEKAVIGLDIGSTSIKGVLVDVSTHRMLEIARRTAPSPTPAASGRDEYDANCFRETAFSVIRELADSAERTGWNITAIGCTGQMHGGLIVDEKMQPLTPFVSWQDKRGDEQFRARTLVEALRDCQSHEDATGVGIHTGFLLTTLYSWSQSVSIPNGKAIGIYDWIISQLAGRLATDITSAAAWAMFDIGAMTWRSEMMEKAGISSSLLPEVVEPGEILGTLDVKLADELHLSRSVTIHASIGDTQASYIGSGCQRNEISLNFGTGSQSMWETMNTIATHATDIRYLRNGRFLATAPTLAGGKAYSILAEFFRDVVKSATDRDVTMDKMFDVMNRLAASTDSEGVCVDPIWAGSRFREIEARGSITGIDTHNLRMAQLTKATIEGMIEEIAAPYFLRREPTDHCGLVGAGNGMRHNPALRLAAESRFALPLRLSPSEEEAAIGAAILAC